MATRIIEYGNLIAGNTSLVPSSEFVTAQNPITATSSPQSSSAFNTATSVVLIQSDEAVYVAFGTSPTATTSNYRIQAGGEQYFAVAPNFKVSVRS